MAARHLLLVVPLFALAACGTDSSEANDAPLRTWEGTWQAAEPLARDDALSVIWQQIHDLRPEYGVDEIRALFIATVDRTSAPATLQLTSAGSKRFERRGAVRPPRGPPGPCSRRQG